VRAALAVACLILACAPAVPNLDSPGRTIVCFGDSLTAGVGRGEGPAYPERLARLLDAEVVNAGVPGDTASQALGRLDRVLAADPWLVVIVLGGNDILRRVPVETTEGALDAVVERLLAAGVVPLLVEVRGPFGGRHAALFDRLESRHGVPVIRDVLPKLLLDRRYKSDPIHLNAAGYERLAEALAQRIEPLLRRRQAA
jgi:lysophospholipase L1-like esterase